MIKPNVEEVLNRIAENSAVVHSAMYDLNLFELAQLGVQRLMNENTLAVAALRETLPVEIMVLDLVDDQQAA
jgi:hypothetical protein